MEEWLTEVQVPHGLWPDWSLELAPDEVGGGVHVRPGQSQRGPAEWRGRNIYSKFINAYL